MFDTATSSTGTMEVGPTFDMPADALQVIGVAGLPHSLSLEKVATFNANTNAAMRFEDSLGVYRSNTV